MIASLIKEFHIEISLFLFSIKMSSSIHNLIVYREGDIVKQPMKKGSFVPKNVPGVGVGWGGVGWGGS